jgi:hypothetical protein
MAGGRWFVGSLGKGELLFFSFWGKIFVFFVVVFVRLGVVAIFNWWPNN